MHATRPVGRRSVLTSAACMVAVGSPGVPHAQNETMVGAQQARDIALEAYLFFYPLVMMGVTRAQTNAIPGAAPNSLSNSFFHVRAFPPADFKAVVRSNFDTLYSSAWLDLTKGPMIVSVPDTDGRFYTLPMLDMWTDVFAAPGKRTTGTAARQFAVVPRGWSRPLPEQVVRIEAPTPYVWICGRTQTNGPRDYAAVHRIQDGYRITPLSHWGQPLPPAPVQPEVHLTAPAPRQQVDNMAPFAFFSFAAELLKTNPPHLTDWSIIARLQRIGIEAGRSYNPERLDPALQQALTDAAANGQKAMQTQAELTGNIVNGWRIDTGTMGVYGNDYLKRAVTAQILLGANQPADAIYPLIVTDADGKRPLGQHKYRLHFAKSELPPVEAFWSISMYDADGYPVANPLNRSVLRDRDALEFNADGSLDLYIQHDNPGSDRAANWLPSPAAGELGLTMRLYAPKPAALNGNWVPPPLLRQ